MTVPSSTASLSVVSVAEDGGVLPAKDHPWWHGAAIYQVYPRSFRDSNGDGIGDLRGCIEGLDHIASLGVDAVWLSPFFTSPMDDFGYDVADYRDVDPIFGTLQDFDDLVAKAHALGLKVIIDQVYSHTSDQHAWFVESRSSRTNPKADWYVWADPKPDGSPPNNWQSVFGGASWTWDNRRRQYYMHNFLTSQPDLNVHNKEVQDALLDVARFWLDRGVDGFRLDAINFAMHDPELRDNPPLRTFARQPTRPFDFQDHCHSKSHPNIVQFLERVRGVMDDYDGAFTVAEIGGPDALNEMKAFTAGETRLNTAYSFDYLYAENLTADLVRKTLNDWPEVDRWPSWAFSNHDAPRAISRWAKAHQPGAYAKFTMALLMSLRGNVFVYQGDELGLEQAEVPFEKLQDPEAIANWPETLGRDGARTPLPWTADAANAGFTSGEPWLPIDARHYAHSVASETGNNDSVLHFTRSLIALRNAQKALRWGDVTFLETPKDLLAFTRRHDNETVLCVFNLGTETTDWQPSQAGAWKIEVTANLEAGDEGALPASLPDASGYIAIQRG